MNTPDQKEHEEQLNSIRFSDKGLLDRAQHKIPFNDYAMIFIPMRDKEGIVFGMEYIPITSITTVRYIVTEGVLVIGTNEQRGEWAPQEVKMKRDEADIVGVTQLVDTGRLYCRELQIIDKRDINNIMNALLEKAPGHMQGGKFKGLLLTELMENHVLENLKKKKIEEDKIPKKEEPTPTVAPEVKENPSSNLIVVPNEPEPNTSNQIITDSTGDL